MYVHFTNASLPDTTHSFPYFFIQMGGRMVKRFSHVSVLHLLVRLHPCSHICVLIFYYPLNVFPGRDLSGDLVYFTLHTWGTRGSGTLRDLSRVTQPVRNRVGHPPDAHTQQAVSSATPLCLLCPVMYLLTLTTEKLMSLQVKDSS